jgi:hypothetical protein
MSYLRGVQSWPLAEKCAARLDGELTQYFLAADTSDNHHARAFAVLGRFDGRLVLTGLSALWALGVADEPRTHHVSQVGSRVKLPQSSSYILEQRVFRPGDLWGSVTSPLRTATDLLRSPDAFSNETFKTLCAIYSLQKCNIESRLKTLGTTPGLTRAYDRLRENQLSSI